MSARHRQRMQHWEERKQRSRATRVENTELKKRIEELKSGERPAELPTKFFELPLSQRTLLGLERGNFKTLTHIQRQSLLDALSGADILGAAKTGSGKTLCFVIPLLERLFRECWDVQSGIGALILAPTRELALQIFRVLQVVGYKHTFSAALLTGGRNVEQERKRLHQINIIIATPGRLLQHLSEDSDMSLENVQILVLDEADRLLDMGFSETVNSILQYVPATRQTLLFSATQTRDVQSLAQLSMKDPLYVSSLPETLAPTPSRMNQNFVIVELHKKTDMLLTFLKEHANDKTIVFMSTCNQVRFMYLAFSKILKKMRVPSMCLTGKMKQFRRDEIFLTFCRCKAAVLFCTDIAARGLDFPMVHWVIQYDCPESAQTYIHRAGRTARAGARGASVLFVTPSERAMLSFLRRKMLPLREIALRPRWANFSSKEIFVALVVQGLKYDAQKAFVSYLRSLLFAANKLVFDVESVDKEKFAASLGLLTVPEISGMIMKRSAKNLCWDLVNKSGEKPPETRRERHLKASDMFRSLQQRQRFQSSTNEADGRDDDDILFKKEKAAEAPEELTFDERMHGLSRHKINNLVKAADLRVKDLGLSKRTVFDAEGSDEDEGEAEAVEDHCADEDEEEYRKELRMRVAESRPDDRQRRRELRRKRDRRGDAQSVLRGAGDNDDDDASSGVSIDDELLLAAKGELYPRDDVEAPARDDEQQEEEIERPRKKSRRVK